MEAISKEYLQQVAEDTIFVVGDNPQDIQESEEAFEAWWKKHKKPEDNEATKYKTMRAWHAGIAFFANRECKKGKLEKS
jgi:predicted Zn-dependent peptidase